MIDLKEKYNPEGSDLRKAQLRMLEILVTVVDICNKHDIKYWLAFGTLLGAVRHKGFIPWDDDLDIEVEFKDYDRLISILRRELPPDLVVQNKSNEPNYFLNFTKVRDKQSIINEDNSSNFKEKGLFIDIFYREKTNKFFKIFSKKIVGASLFYYHLERLDYKRKNFILKAKYKIRILLFYAFVSFARIVSLLCKDKKFYIGLPILSQTVGLSYDELFPLKTIEFEKKVFNIPNNYNSYLNKYYGNYMQLPPEEDICVHSTEFKFLK